MVDRPNLILFVVSSFVFVVVVVRSILKLYIEPSSSFLSLSCSGRIVKIYGA